MKQLLFFDIDGTLAIPGQAPQKEVVRAIRSARAHGHKAFLCTGRTEQSVPDVVQKIGFDGGIYSAGGRVIVGTETILDHAMAHEMTQMIISAMHRAGLWFTLECGHENYAGGSNPLLSVSIDASSGNSELQRILLAADKKPFTQYQDEPVYKVSFLAASQEQIDNLVGALNSRVKVVRFDNLKPGFPLFAGEVSDKNIHKGLALQCVCTHLGVNPKLSVAFGDSMNDAEMLSAAGIGVAMGNSSDQVKDLADQVCESCTDNGVAKALIRLGLADPMG